MKQNIFAGQIAEGMTVRIPSTDMVHKVATVEHGVAGSRPFVKVTFEGTALWGMYYSTMLLDLAN